MNLVRIVLVALVAFAAAPVTVAAAEDPWPPEGSYDFTAWAGPKLSVHYAIPDGADADTPIVVVIPGARRNAGDYRDQWSHLATANGFIAVVPQARRSLFPTEYDYNLGGVIDAQGRPVPAEQTLFAAIDPLFDDFCNRFGSNRKTYDLYGHSAGGGFVHLFLLIHPEAKVDVAVAANPAFATLPDESAPFPFGVANAPVDADAVEPWFSKRLVVLLGDRDLNPRTQALSNGPEARRQGPHVFARGLKLYQTALTVAAERDLPLSWRLEVVPGVGHSNTLMAPYAVKHLSLGK